MNASSNTPAVVLLAVATVAAFGLLVLAAVDRGSVIAWATVPLPIVQAGAAGRAAAHASRRGEGQSSADLLTVGLTANVIVACLAALIE